MRGCNKFKCFYKNKLYNKAIYFKGSKSVLSDSTSNNSLTAL